MAILPGWMSGWFGVGSNATDEQGVGQIRARTIEIGATVLAIDNIGSMVLVTAKKDWRLAILGGVLALVGLSMIRGSVIFGLLLILVGGGLIALNFYNKVDNYLSIGTGDGRLTNIVSKDRKLLEDLRAVLRRKIDSKNVTMFAKFDTKGGGVVVGQGVATGAASNVGINQSRGR